MGLYKVLVLFQVKLTDGHFLCHLRKSNALSFDAQMHIAVCLCLSNALWKHKLMFWTYTSCQDIFETLVLWQTCGKSSWVYCIVSSTIYAQWVYIICNNRYLSLMCRLRIGFMSADGLSSGAPCHPRLRWFCSGKRRASWGSAGVRHTRAAGESRWRSDTPLLHHNRTTFTAAHTAAWVTMGNVLQLSVVTSTRQLRWRLKRAETLRTHD